MSFSTRCGPKIWTVFLIWEIRKIAKILGVKLIGIFFIQTSLFLGSRDLEVLLTVKKGSKRFFSTFVNLFSFKVICFLANSPLISISRLLQKKNWKISFLSRDRAFLLFFRGPSQNGFSQLLWIYFHLK